MQWIAALSDEVAAARFLAGPPVSGGIAILSAEVARERAGALRAHGLTHAAVEVHGPVQEAHGLVASVFGAGPPPPLDAALATAAHARAHGLGPVVASRVSRSGARVLREVGALAAGAGAVRWILVMPWLEPALPLPQLPRAALAMPFVLDAARRAESDRLAVALVGAPLCLVGPHAGLVVARTGAAGPPCDACPSRAVCSGIGPSYRERFGAAELHPATAEPGPADPIVAAVVAALR